MLKLVIFDFDGTLFDSYDAIAHSMRLTFEALLPGHIPSPAALDQLISIGAPPEYTFRALHPDLDNFDEAQWVKKYREIYAVHGQPLTRAYPGALEVVRAVKDRNIPVAIISNKAAIALKTALSNSEVGSLIPDALVIGDGMFTDGRRKPDPAGFTDVLLPRLKEAYGDDFLTGGGEDDALLMVGDTVTDLRFARNIGAQVCWCRYGQGNREECEQLQPDFTIDTLIDFMSVLDRP